MTRETPAETAERLRAERAAARLYARRLPVVVAQLRADRERMP